MLDGTYGEVFKFIQQYMLIHRQAPSLSEIADGCRTSTTTALKCVQMLEKRGYIERDAGKKRSIKVLKGA